MRPYKAHYRFPKKTLKNSKSLIAPYLSDIILISQVIVL